MNYPLISEYKEAIKSAEENFEELKHLRPVLDEEGEPMMTSGNFAVVFKMKDEQTGKLHAVKCFLKEQEGRAEAYRQIAEELEYVSSTFLTPIKYLDKELFVDSKNSDETEFPVLLMDWVEGITLDKYVREHIDDQYELSLLAYQFSRLAMWLMPQPFAHGDLKPDNILVKDDGTLVLVDYDGMYVPAMKGQKARELGSPDFRHPSRTENDFDEHIDDFSLASILLSLKAISLQPSLLEEYGASDRLLFSEKDYRNLSESKVMDALKPLMQDAELASLYSLYILALSQNNLSQVSFRLFNLKRPDKSQYEEENLNSKNLKNVYVDLGLSVKWAKCNLGANKPEEFGDYFEWGCLSPQNENKEVRRNTNFGSKYNTADGKKVLCPEDDAATCLLGMPWRMPTLEEITELKEKCEWKESSLNGVQGCRVIGPNGNSIFLPLAGSYDWGRGIPRPYKSGYGAYWSSSSYIHNFVFDNSWYLSIHRGKPDVNHYVRAMVYPIRPVMIEDDDLSTEVKEEDLINAWTDEFGVMYSADRRRLLKINNNLWEKEEWHYTIYNGTKVICDHAFHPWKNSYRNCGTASIKIPDSVRKIGEAAFMGIGLSSIVIPKNVKEIGCNILAANPYLDSIIVDERNPFFDSRNNCKAIIKSESNELVIGCKSTIIPFGVSIIGREAFSNCYNLVSIDLPNGVETIGEKAFFYCENLCNINLPQTITTIDSYAFEGSSLAYINLGDNIQSLGEKIFDSYRFKRIYASKQIQDRIKEITHEYDKYFDEAVSTIYDFNNACEDEVGAKYSKDRLRLLSIPETVEEYVIKDGTEYICDYAFVGGSSGGLLRSAFASKYKVNIISITLPGSIIAIGKNAFAGCNDITTIYIPVGTKKKFEKLLSKHINKLVEIDEGESYSTEVTDEDFANAWVDECGVMYSADRKRLLKAPKGIFNYTIKQGTIVICELAFWENENIISVIMPDCVSFIGRCAFENCRNLSSVIFSNKIQYLSDSVFHGCTSLKSIDIPNSIKVIGENAFAYCIGISSLSLPDSVIEIEYNAFSLCKNLESVYISDSIQKINPQAFHGCSKIHSLVVGAGNKYYDSRNNCNAIIEIKSKTLIIGCSSSVIPNDVTRIGPYAFDWCEGLSSITIPDNILELDRYSFSNCNTLTTIIIPRNVEKISCYSFYGCKNLSSLIVDNDNRIYDSRNDCNAIIETANNTLVLGCSNSTIPSGVIQIGNHAFGGCKSIVSIVLPKTIKKIDDWAFSGCESLATISLPNDLTEIGYGAFSQCRNLKSIIIPSSVTKIANHAFFECKELENVFLPEGVEELGQYAFARCESLTSIHLPDSLAQIGGWAFDNCCRLKSIFVPAGTINKFRVLFPKWCWHLLVEEQR